MPLKELIEMESMILKTDIKVFLAKLNDSDITLDFETETGFYNYFLTRAECVQLAQMLLRVSDTLTEGDKE